MRNIRLALLMIVLLGLGYPAAMTGLAQLLFPHQAKGSIIYEKGRAIGSELIGQSFRGTPIFTAALRRFNMMQVHQVHQIMGLPAKK